MMLPGFSALMSRFPDSRATRQAPLRLVSITRSQSLGAISSADSPWAIPELLTRMSMHPQLRSASSKPFVTVFSSVTSMFTARASPPCEVISTHACSSSSIRRPVNTTEAPAAASTDANVRPRPLDAPVTIAVRPDSENSVSFMGEGNKIYTESVNWVTVSTASVTQLAWALGA